MQPPAPAQSFRIGFTGTQAGMTLAQKVQVASALDSLDTTRAYEFHHGCCIGADEEFHNLVRSCSFRNATIIGHPGDSINKQSYRCQQDCDELHKAIDNLKRNHKIVGLIETLWAAPKTNHETLRSGTWATMRYAYKKPIPTVEFYPDGVVVRLEN